MGFIKLNKNSETSFENIIVLIFIFILAVITAHRYKNVIKYGRTAAYKEDVQKINAALIVYRIKYGKFPDNLSVLVKKGFIENIKIDKESYPISPFGKKFVYRRKYGRVLYISGGGAGT
jgi:type II secretory pathway pseudopilin PulG